MYMQRYKVYDVYVHTRAHALYAYSDRASVALLFIPYCCIQYGHGVHVGMLLLPRIMPCFFFLLLAEKTSQVR